MTERLFLKLLLTLFSSLLAAELLLVLLFGFRLDLIAFAFVIAVALTGIVIVVHLMAQPRPEIDSVSARRAKAKRSDVMRDRLSAYTVDEEFLGGKRFTESPISHQAPSPSSSSSLLENHSLDQESFDDYIRRSMTSSDEDGAAGSGDGFSVDLDEAALPRGIGRPPDDFSHNPKAMMESLKRAGMKQ